MFELVITAVGFNVTVSVNGVPAQLLIVGVITYNTLFGLVVLLVRVSVISPVPLAVAGLTPVTAALLQVNTGVGVVELRILYVLETPLHQFAVPELVITEVGFTVTARSKVVPAQVLRVGVIR